METGAENGPDQVQKWLPLTGPFLGPGANFTCQFKRAMKKDARVIQIAESIADRFPIPFFGLGVAE